MARFVPGIEQAVVKTALSHTAGSIIPPRRAQRIIAEAAERAVRRLGEIAPADHPGPYDFEIELRQPLSDAARAAFADRFPEFTVVGDRTVTWSADDMHVCFRRAAITSFIAEAPDQIRRY